MTLDEALAELGIDRSAGNDGARRAYLRLLKTRKPEADPEGFMRLREAYELVKSAPWIWQAPAAVSVVPVAPAVPIVTPAPPPVVDPPVEASFPEEIFDFGRLSRRKADRAEEPVPAPAAFAEDQPPREDEARAQAEDQAQDRAAPAGAREDAREEQAAREDRREDRREAGEEHDARDDEDDGERDEDDEDEDEDEDEDDEEQEDERARGPGPRPDVKPPVDARGVDELMRAGKYREAAAAMSAIYAAASKQLFGSAPPVRETLRMMLSLHAKNALEEAAAVKKSFAAWLAASGQEARLLRGEPTVLWTLVRELDALPASLPAEVRASIARAALLGDLAHARTDLASFRIMRRSAALAAGGTIRRSAPTIAAAVADALDPPAPVSPSYVEPRRQQSGKSGWWVVMVVLMGLLRVFASIGSSSSPSYSPPSFNIPHYTIPTISPLIPFDAGALLGLQLETLKGAVVMQAMTVETKAAVEYPDVAKKAREVMLAAENANCATAKVATRTLMAMVKRLPKKPGVDRLDTEASLLNIQLRNYCAELGYRDGADSVSSDAGASGRDAGSGPASDAGASGRTAGSRGGTRLFP